jgi:hypothetical protein
MTTMNDILRIFGDEYIKRFPNMPPSHYKTIQAISDCRSGELGTIIYQCSDCKELHVIGISCGNRHCPGCQYHKTQQWLQKQLAKQLAEQYFMITFTLPQELRLIIRKYQKEGYNALFKASSEALKKLAKDKRFIGTDLPGFTGVLHTWGRQLHYHPHIHYIVAGGGLSNDHSEWIPSRKDFYVHIKPLSKLYKNIFKREIVKAGIIDKIPSNIWKQDWVVDSQAVGKAEASFKYLAPYVFKVAISNSKIIKVEDRNVFFKYKKSGSRKHKIMKLEVMEFIRRYLQHVLPSGFMKVRHYGFMNPGCKIPFEIIAKLVEIKTGDTIISPVNDLTPLPVFCQDCGGILDKVYIDIVKKPK